MSILRPCTDDAYMTYLWCTYPWTMSIDGNVNLFLNIPPSLTCAHDHVGGNIDGVPKGENLKVLQKSEVAFIQQAQVCQSNWHSEMHPKMKTSKSYLRNNSRSCQRSLVWLLMLLNASWWSSMIPNLRWFAIILYMILYDTQLSSLIFNSM